MTASILLLCLASQFCLVTGQLLTKHAMNATNLSPTPWRRVIGRLSLGIVVLTNDMTSDRDTIMDLAASLDWSR